MYIKIMLVFFLFLFYKEITVHSQTHALSPPSDLKSQLIIFTLLKCIHGRAWQIEIFIGKLSNTFLFISTFQTLL